MSHRPYGADAGTETPEVWLGSLAAGRVSVGFGRVSVVSGLVPFVSLRFLTVLDRIQGHRFCGEALASESVFLWRCFCRQ